jgi:hypothetical protein
MPVDWDKVERLRLERFGDRRYGEPGIPGFENALGFSYQAYRHHLETAQGKRNAGKGERGGIPLRYVEAIAQALEVPLAEVLNGETRSAEFERGLRNGRLQALAEVHDLLNGLMRRDG